MKPEEVKEYQENEIELAHSHVNDRMEHLAGRVSDGILNGEMMNEHHNRRTKAYLEGYADALKYAAREIDSIQNMTEYLPEDVLALSNEGDDE